MMYKRREFCPMIGQTRIAFTRLAEIVRPGDVIEGACSKVPTSGEGWWYRVTHVAWWGVYAILNPDKLSKLRMSPEAKGHHKFKWCNIWSYRLD
jgi:hypothetical protein